MQTAAVFCGFVSALDFVHPALVAAALKFRVEEGVQDPVGHVVPDHPAAHGQHVGVVVPPGHLGGQGLAAQGAADTLHLVGGDGDADAGGADDDAPVTFAGGHRLRRGPAEVGVVAALIGIAAEVVIRQSAGVQVLHHVALEGEPSVVTAQCDHVISSLQFVKYRLAFLIGADVPEAAGGQQRAGRLHPLAYILGGVGVGAHGDNLPAAGLVELQNGLPRPDGVPPAGVDLHAPALLHGGAQDGPDAAVIGLQGHRYLHIPQGIDDVAS